jgi:hypothetical protein
VFLLFVSIAITTQISINLPEYSRLHVGLLSDIIVLILRTQSVEKSLQEISRFNLSTDFGGALKTLFGGVLKKHFAR